MTAEKKDLRPLHIKNLADLKRHIRLGTELVATAHQYHPDIVGLTRVVTKVQTNGFYSKIKDQPDHKWSTCNHGLGFWSPFNKAGAYHFTDSTVQVLNTRKNDGSVLYEMELYDDEQSMSEQNKEVSDVNEWDRLHRQAQRYGNIAKGYGYNVSVIDLRNPTRSNGNNLLHLVNKYMDLYQANPDTVAENGNRKVQYANKAELMDGIVKKYHPEALLEGDVSGEGGEMAEPKLTEAKNYQPPKSNRSRSRQPKPLPEQADKDGKKGGSQPSEKQMTAEPEPEPVPQEVSDGQT
jgi:TRAG family protein